MVVSRILVSFVVYPLFRALSHGANTPVVGPANCHCYSGTLHPFTSIKPHAQATPVPCTHGTTTSHHPIVGAARTFHALRWASKVVETKPHQYGSLNTRNAHKPPSGGFEPSEIAKKSTVSEIQPPKRKETQDRREEHFNGPQLSNRWSKIKV